jgi:hypothetical protein
VGSIQFNYFASGSDLVAVATIILEWCPNLFVFPPRGSGGNLSGQSIGDPRALVPRSLGEKHLLCAAENAQMIQTTFVNEQISCIRSNENPVLEFSPSAPVDSETVKIGRFYANYDNIEFMNEVKKLFRYLRRQSTEIGHSDVWIFPDAAKSKRLLKMWAGKDWENPFVSEIRPDMPSELSS